MIRIATPDLITNSYFPALAAEELGLYREEGIDAHVELLPSLDAVNALRDGQVDFVADGPPGAGQYTFAGLSTSDALIEKDPDRVSAAVRAIVRAQRTLKADPKRATDVGRRRFPAAAAEIIADVVARDVPFYDPVISEA